MDWLRATALLSVVGLVACATVKETYAPDGRKAYTLNCSGLARGWDKCFKAAGDICQAAGYDVLDRISEDKSSASVGGSNGSFGGSAVKTNERSMVIACKKPS
jgi:hypothetical protein